MDAINELLKRAINALPTWIVLVIAALVAVTYLAKLFTGSQSYAQLIQQRSYLILLAVIVACAVVYASYRHLSKDKDVAAFQPGEYGVLIAEIPENAQAENPEDRTVTQLVIDSIVDSIGHRPISGTEVIDVRPLGEAIPAVHGTEAALEIGRRYGAKHVAWGWYSKGPVFPVVQLHFDTLAEATYRTTVRNLDDPRVSPENYVREFQAIRTEPSLSEPLSFDFFLRTTYEIGVASKLVVGFLSYVRGDFANAEVLLHEVATSRSQNTKMSAYAHFLMGNISHLRNRLPAQEYRGEYVRSALSHFFAASELLSKDQAVDRALRSRIENNIGAVLISQGAYQKASRFVTSSIKLNPHLATAQANLGRLLLFTSDSSSLRPVLSPLPRAKDDSNLTAAIAALERAIDLNPELLAPRLWLASAHLSLRHSDQAVRVLEPLFSQLSEHDTESRAIPDAAVTSFLEFFGPELLSKMIEPERIHQVTRDLQRYLKENEKNFHMFSMMNPRAMAEAGRKMDLARTAMDILKTSASADAISVGPADAHELSGSASSKTQSPSPVFEAVQKFIDKGAYELAKNRLGDIIDSGEASWPLYVLGKLLLEENDLVAANLAFARGLKREIEGHNYSPESVTIRFRDGKRHTSYSDFVDLIFASLRDQAQFKTTLGLLLKRLHLLTAADVDAMVARDDFDWATDDLRRVYRRKGVASAKAGDFIEAAKAFAEATKHATGEELLEALLAKVSALQAASGNETRILESINQTEEVLQSLETGSSNRISHYQYIACLWRAEIAVKGWEGGPVDCLTAYLGRENQSPPLQALWYTAELERHAGNVGHWQDLLESLVAGHSIYHLKVGVWDPQLSPHTDLQIFHQAMEDLAAYYRKNTMYEKLGGLLFYVWNHDGEDHFIFESPRLEIVPVSAAAGRSKER